MTVLTPDPERAERVRVKCHIELARSQRREARTAATMGSVWRLLAPVVVGAFCVFYVAMLVATTLRLERIFH